MKLILTADKQELFNALKTNQEVSLAMLGRCVANALLADELSIREVAPLSLVGITAVTGDDNGRHNNFG